MMRKALGRRITDKVAGPVIRCDASFSVVKIANGKPLHGWRCSARLKRLNKRVNRIMIRKIVQPQTATLPVSISIR
jgi:hypothetical protein